MKFKIPINTMPKNIEIEVSNIPAVPIDSGISSNKEINNMIPAEKPIPIAIPFTLFFKKIASITPINVVRTERKDNKITAVYSIGIITNYKFPMFNKLSYMDKVKIILNYIEKKYGKYIDTSPMKNQEIFELLIETVLSQRTRDENSEKAADQLFAVAKTPKQILKLQIRKLQSLIRISGPYRQKAKRIKQISRTILKKYKGKVPHNREELMKLPGIGYKTADIVLMYGFGIPRIAVDTHCNRVPKRIGLVNKKANVEEVREKLESLFPKNKWYLINLGFVSFGKEICKPVNPLCIKDSKKCLFSKFCKAYKTKNFKV